MTEETLTDDEWDHVQEYNAKWIGEILDFVDDDSTKPDLVVETDKYIVIAETDAYSSDEAAEKLDLASHRVQNSMRKKAKQLTDYDWEVTSPYVIEKPPSYRAGERHLLRQIAERTDKFGSVARSVDTLAVERYGYSQSDWAEKSGRNRSTVSRTTNN